MGTHPTTQTIANNHNNKHENMLRNNHQYKVGDKILFKRKENSNYELEFMGPFPITQINYNGTVSFQKGIINGATNIRRINHSVTKHINNKNSFHHTVLSIKKNDNGMVHFQQGIINYAANKISTHLISL